MTTDRLKPVRIWLYLLALLILLMVAVGGITRLTGSGLSITSWRPISGIVPPLSAADWLAEFEAYKQIPEFKIENRWMDVAAFKSIFWWEWGHRFLGRLIGIAFLIPFLVFLGQRRLSWHLAPGLGLLFVLGGFQGFLGWWMVSSGLSERTGVSQYRLAAHLAAAAMLFAAILWVARRLAPPRRDWSAPGWRWAIRGLAFLVFFQIVLGAFVAGIDAGFSYNTWPLMDGAWIPDHLGVLRPAWRNLFENALTVQFAHRFWAYLIVAYALILVWWGRGRPDFVAVHSWMLIILVLLGIQFALGILTLVMIVPLPMAIAHQVVAFTLLGAIVAYVSDMENRVR